MGFLVKKHCVNPYRHTPATKQELIDAIVSELRTGNTNLNCIDVSLITDMSWLFNEVEKQVLISAIDISDWNVEQVVDMSYLFANCHDVEVDISRWRPLGLQAKVGMFKGCAKLDKILLNGFFA